MEVGNRHFWHMQIHPGDGSLDDAKVQKIVETYKVVGMGDSWDNDKGQPQTFMNNVAIGDIILIRHNSQPKYLVEVKSDIKQNNYVGEMGNVWFPIYRYVEVLEKNIDKTEYQRIFGKNWTDGIYAPSTIARADDWHYMNYLYAKYIKEKQMECLIKLLENNHNLILTGAPGTGKTYLAKEIAKSMGCTDDEIGFVQFHPSYDYTDFVEGLRPMQDDNGTVGFERKDGVFKEFCKKALKNLKDSEKTVEKLQEEKTFEDLFKVLCEEIQNGLSKIKLRSNVEVDIVGMNKDCTAIYLMPQNSIRDERYTMSLNRLSKLSERFKTIEDLEAITNVSKSVAEAINGCQGSYYWATLRYIYGIRKRFVSNQSDVISLKKVEKKSFVFIIDEINRGEISKIWGELFFSVDPGYRGLDENDKPKGLVKTQYQNLVDEDDEFFGGFYVPENVYIIGTMNDIDRSVESMDFAFRRRFAFKEIKANENIGMLDELGDVKDEAKKRMLALNEAISKISGLNSAYHIGGAYFLKLKNYDNNFDELWANHLDGLLREYLRGRRQEEIEEKMKILKQAYDSAN